MKRLLIAIFDYLIDLFRGYDRSETAGPPTVPNTWRPYDSTTQQPISSRPDIRVEDLTVTGSATIGGTAVPKILQTSGALDFGSVAAQTATTSLVVALTGVATGDPVAWTFGGDPGGLAFMVRVETNQIKVYAVNVTAGAIDPGSLTFYFAVIQ